MTDVTQAPAEGTTTEQGEGADGAVHEMPNVGGRSKRNTAPIQVTVPLDLKAQIEKLAEDANMSSAQWILRRVAAELGYTLPEASARQSTRPQALFPKTLSPEAKKERFDAARTLLAALDRGDIDLAALKEKMGL